MVVISSVLSLGGKVSCQLEVEFIGEGVGGRVGDWSCRNRSRNVNGVAFGPKCTKSCTCR